MLELGIFSVMWSEHCSYKSSRFWLKQFPTSRPPGYPRAGRERGRVDIGDGDAIIFKMESHNHPSYIEPYQGAATGVGGIMRDVFTMGARPIANLKRPPLWRPDHPKTRRLVSGVVAGIGGYGNCVGVPTVGGETNFDRWLQRQHPCQRHVRRPRQAPTRFSTRPQRALVCRSSTSARKPAATASTAPPWHPPSSMIRAMKNAPPFKSAIPSPRSCLIEACLELMATDMIIAIQDMGAAGLTSSTSEMADKGGVGIELNLDHRAAARTKHDGVRDDALGKPRAHAHDPEARPRTGS